ncbi:MAG: Arabinose efflux permease, partial [Porphyrobacter sp. HL-46]
MALPPARTTEAHSAYRWYVLGLLTLTSAFSVADRLVFGILVEDVLGETRTLLAEVAPRSAGEVRAAGRDTSLHR